MIEFEERKRSPSGDSHDLSEEEKDTFEEMPAQIGAVALASI